MGLLSRIVLGGNEFALQFLQCGGILNGALKSMLNEADVSNSVVIDALLIISQLARVSQESYSQIHEADLYQDFLRLIQSEDPSIRSKICNLTGNLCRYSDFFYEPMRDSGLLDQLVEMCSDSDKNVRKFACFAIGNASFHNDSLYQHIASSIPALVILLEDQEEKTRSNAAGAIGNLVRNSDILCDPLFTSGAVDKLFQVAKNDLPGPKKIALFSLGNFCAFAQWKAALIDMGVDTYAHQIVDSQNADPMAKKYSQRILKKLSVKGDTKTPRRTPSIRG
eukprot:TRINITY_DN444_c0_g1_i8.p1 TRINITY_DN444_c0_g1~~TRINITY_DN444_c0_g1_i8.p1  ORF type:complete len:280 (+),score=70.09 TRINITY_DN444_c0_g1_i8:466-1305(+)